MHRGSGQDAADEGADQERSDQGRRDRQEGQAAGERADEREADNGEQNEEQNPDEDRLLTDTVVASPPGISGISAFAERNDKPSFRVPPLPVPPTSIPMS